MRKPPRIDEGALSERDGLKRLKRIDERVAGKTGAAFFRGIVQELIDANAAFAGQLDADVDALRLFSLRCAAETERGRYEARLEYANAELQKEITRRQVIEAELITARQLAEATNQAKNGFISNLRHALRTPVNGIIDHTQLLQKNSALLGLEWIECGRSDADALASPAYVCVPILATQLHDLAQRGDVLNLTALAERMLAQDPAAAAMLARLQSLAAQFDMRGMRELPAAQLASTSSAAGERAPVG